MSAWDESIDMGALYVPRPGTQPLPDGRAPVSIAERIRNQLLRTQGPLKIFLTGQVGAGKSSELSRLYADAEIAKKFERVVVRLTDRVDLLNADIRQVLVAIAATVAEHVRKHDYHKLSTWRGGEASKDLRRWVELLGTLFELPPPNPGDDPVIEFGAAFFKFSAELRSQHTLRQKIREDQGFGPLELLKVTNLMLRLLESAVNRRVLLVIDDGDKVAMPDPARNVFIEHRVQLMELRCLAVLTFPYTLNFDPDLPSTNDLFVLENIKVIDRATPNDVRPDAIAFFRELLGRRVAASLITDEAVATATRYGAGIPREFLRIVAGGFEFAHNYGYAQVDHDAIEYVVQELRVTASRRTQGDKTRRMLAQVHRTKGLPDDFERSLLETLLVVEYSNNTPWYDVNPILVEYVESFGVIEDGE
ncbi:hypothetical protein ACNOYE_28340 [Nannocystaceae bacterium ST9]